MPASPGHRRQASIIEGLRGLVDMGASTLRGGVAATLGVPGDIGEIVNKLRGAPDKGVLPTTDEWKQVLPQTGVKGGDAYESVGEYGNPLTPAKKALALSSALGHVPAASAIFVPAMKLKDPKIAKEVLDDMNAGIDAKELWKKHQLSYSPTRPVDDPRMGKFWQELNDQNARISSTIPQLSKTEKLNYIKQNFSPLQQQGAMRRGMPMQVPMPGEYKLGDFLEHPELFQMFPHLKGGKVKVVDDPKDPSRGSYHSRTGEIELNIPRYLDVTDPGGGMVGTTLHETTHKLANDFDMPSGASTQFYDHPKEVWNALEGAIHDPEFHKEIGPEGMRHIVNLLRYKTENPLVPYKNAPGEKYASAAQTRFGYSPETRRTMDPHQDELKGIYDEPDSDFANYVLQGTQFSLGSGDKTAKILPEILRQYGVLK